MGTKITDVTTAANELIPEYIDQGDEPVAVVVASAFVEVRLKTLISELMSTRNKNVKELYERIELSRLVKMCYAFDLISLSETSKLQELISCRNKLAHNSLNWRKRTKEQDRRYRTVSRSALEFLNTVGTLKKVRARQPIG